MVGDRGMITQTQIDELREMDGVDWITARASRTDSHELGQRWGAPDGELFDERNLFVTHSGFPQREAGRLPQSGAGRGGVTAVLVLEATSKELEKVCRPGRAAPFAGQGRHSVLQ